MYKVHIAVTGTEEKIGMLLCQMRTADIVDVVTWSVGCESVGEVAKGGTGSKGWAVVSKPGTRVDGYLHHEQESWFSK
jgi:hypothetical protein